MSERAAGKRDWVRLEERFRRDPLPQQLGNLASNLARLSSFAQKQEYQDVAEEVLEESEYFADWAAQSASSNVQMALREIQLTSALVRMRLERAWSDPLERERLARKFRTWSGELLKASRLVNDG